MLIIAVLLVCFCCMFLVFLFCCCRCFDCDGLFLYVYIVWVFGVGLKGWCLMGDGGRRFYITIIYVGLNNNIIIINLGWFWV